MVAFGKAQPPKYSASASSGSIRQRNPTATASSITQSDPPSPHLSQLDTSQPLESPSPSYEQVGEGGEEGDDGRASFSTLLGTYVIRPLLRLLILVVALSLLTVWLSIACESDFKIVEDVADQDQPLDATSGGSSSFSGSSSSIRSDVPDFAYLVNRQAAMFGAFSQFLSSLNTPIILDDKSSNSYPYRENINNGYHPDDTDQVVEQGSYGLEALSVASGKEVLPLYMSMKMSELAVIDLKVAAMHSLLPVQTRTLLVDHLGYFQMAAKAHTRKLQFLEARNKGWVDGVIARNMFLGAELQRLEGISGKQYVAWYFFGPAYASSFAPLLIIMAIVFVVTRKVASVEKTLDRLFFSALKEDRKQLKMIILQVQELQQSLDAMDQTRQTIQEIQGHERGHQEQLQRDIMAYVWTHLGGHQFEQETYRSNLALLRTMDKQQKWTGGRLHWILSKLTGFEAELENLWERMSDVGVIEPQEGARKGQSQGQGTAKRANGKKKTAISLQDEIDQIETVTNNLKARKVPAF